MLRDLATYESGFAQKNHDQVGLALVSIQRRIAGTQRTMKANWPTQQAQSFIPASAKNTLIQLLSGVVDFTQKTWRQDENNKHSNIGQGFHSMDVKVNQLKHLIKGTMMMAFQKKQDHFSGHYKISGIRCVVQAEQLNSRVVGRVSCSRSNKLYQFDYKQLTRKRFNIHEELLRLYFDLR